MGIKEIIQKISGMGIKEPEQLPEGMTADGHLRSLRRQRTKQLEELEKEHLRKEIAEYNLEKTRALVGFKKHSLQKKIKIHKKKDYFRGGYLEKSKL